MNSPCNNESSPLQRSEAISCSTRAAATSGACGPTGSAGNRAISLRVLQGDRENMGKEWKRWEMMGKDGNMGENMVKYVEMRANDDKSVDDDTSKMQKMCKICHDSDLGN